MAMKVLAKHTDGTYEYVDPATVPGAVGATGDTGAVGAIGATGAQGETGPAAELPDPAANAGAVLYCNGDEWLPVSLPLDSSGRLSMDSMPAELISIFELLLDPSNGTLDLVRAILNQSRLPKETEISNGA